MFSYRYAYLLGSLFILFPIWLILFHARPDLRHAILKASLLVGIGGPLSELLYTRDYWQPQNIFGWRIGIEDFLYGFLIGGIACSIYEVVFRKALSRNRDRTHQWSHFILPIFAAMFILLNSLVFVFNINSIYASILIFISFALFALWLRHDLLIASLISGVFVGTVMFVGYLIFLHFYPQAIHRWWFLDNISGILVLGVPLEELVWAFSWGMAGGIMYEFFTGLKFIKYRPSVI
jgi:hypothetical protein